VKEDRSVCPYCKERLIASSVNEHIETAHMRLRSRDNRNCMNGAQYECMITRSERDVFGVNNNGKWKRSKWDKWRG